MNCPVCNVPLTMTERQNVEICSFELVPERSSTCYCLRRGS
jgi:Zn-finger nucleic acid-binding protein